jgi:hypothetical protein
MAVWHHSPGIFNNESDEEETIPEDTPMMSKGKGHSLAIIGCLHNE